MLERKNILLKTVSYPKSSPELSPITADWSLDSTLSKQSWGLYKKSFDMSLENMTPLNIL